jgi:hypothetical protein
MLSFGFLAQTTPPALVLANAQHPRHLYVTNLHPPPLTITPHRSFTRHPQNRATNARFWVFGPNPAPRPRVGKHTAPTPPPCHQPAPTTSHHHPMLLFYMAPLRLSHKPHPPTSHWRMRSTHAGHKTASTTSHHHPAVTGPPEVSDPLA